MRIPSSTLASGRAVRRVLVVLPVLALLAFADIRPIQWVHGAADATVPHEHAQRLAAASSQEAHPCRSSASSRRTASA